MQQGTHTATLLSTPYDIALAPGITFKPFLDYISNPDQIGIAKPSPSLTHSLVVGAAISVFFPEAFGLPKLGL